MRDPLDGAPLAIIISGTKDWRWSTFDCALACSQMSVAAESLGLGTHIVMGPTDVLSGDQAAELRKRLAIPEDMVPVVVLLVGYPREGADAASGASERKPNPYKIIE